jgi:hypothetical protein
MEEFMRISFEGVSWRKQFVLDIIRRLGIIAKISDSKQSELVLVCNANEKKVEEMIDHAKNGASVIFLQPQQTVLKLFGSELMYTYHFPLMQINCDSIPVTFLQTFPPISLIKQKYGENYANFAYDFSVSGENYTTKYPAIAWKDIGSGKICVFLYDFVATVLLLLQGWEFFTSEGNLTPKFKKGISRALHLADNLINSQLSEIPQAFFHELVLLDIIRKMFESKGPVPRIWYYPFPYTNVLLLNGDSDNLEKKKLEKSWDFLVKNHLPYTMYTMVDDITKFSTHQLHYWMDKGIDFGFHYFAGQSPSPEVMFKHLIDSRKIFLSKKVEFVSCRGHSLIWVGWDSQIKIMQDAQLCYSSNLLYWEPGVSYGFPYYLYTSAGKSTVQELQVFTSDDINLFNKSGRLPSKSDVYERKLIAWLDVNQKLYYQPLNPIFHPHYMFSQQNTSEIILQIASYAKSSGIPVMNHKMFFKWWEKRQNIKLDYQFNDDHIEFSGMIADDIGIAISEKWQNKKIPETIKLEGTKEILFSTKSGKIFLKRRHSEKKF